MSMYPSLEDMQATELIKVRFDFTPMTKYCFLDSTSQKSLQ
jgi:hypothetical protein